MTRSPRIFRTPESPPGQGAGLGSDNGSLNGPATGRVKGSREREAGGHSGSAGAASSGFTCFGHQNLDFDHGECPPTQPPHIIVRGVFF